MQGQANLVLAMALSLYIVVAIYSAVYSYRRLHRPGVSAKVRNLFVKKHFRYVVVFIIIWMVQQSNNYYNLFNPTSVQFNEENPYAAASPYYTNMSSMARLGMELGLRPKYASAAESNSNDDDNANFVTVLSSLMTFSTGIFLTGVRLYEPLFRVLILQIIY